MKIDYQKLFTFFHAEHDLPLNESEMDEIVHEVQEFLKTNNPFSNLKVGDYLTAIDVCEMELGGEALTVGRRYKIKELDIDSILIDSNTGKHYFTIQDLHIYFKR